MRKTALSLICCLALLAPALVNAAEKGSTETRSSWGHQTDYILDRGTHQRDQMFSLFFFPSWGYDVFGVGLGARYTLPVVHDGFIPALNDSFELEFGADMWTWHASVAMYIPAEARWTFHITDRFAAYAKVGFGYAFGFNDANSFGSPVGFSGGPGVVFNVNKTFVLRAEVNENGFYGTDLRGGIGWAF